MSLDSETTGKYKVVLSDRSGEDYRQFSGSDDEIKENQILKVAEHVVFFIDGDRMMSNYASLRYAYKNLLQELTGKSLLPENSQLKLVFNKHDLVKDRQGYAANKEKKQKGCLRKPCVVVSIKCMRWMLQVRRTNLHRWKS